MNLVGVIVAVGAVLTGSLGASPVIYNVALNKPVKGIHLTGDTQDTYQFLVDGNTQTCADSGTLVVGPAFRIDLGEECLIEAVKLTYAPICATSKTGYGCYFHTTVIEIKGGDDNPTVTDCGHLEDDRGKEAQGEAYLECTPGPVIGRYVTIRKETTNIRSIYLCEMQVIGIPMKKEVGSLKHLHVSPTEGNVALYKPVTGIGLVGDGVNTYPFLVDGDSGTCADSGTLVFDPALQIDLGEEYFVEGVKLVFAPTCAVSISGHGCYYKHTTVHVGNDRHHPDHDECVHLQNIPGESRGEIVLHYSPGPVRGRYVTLKKEEDMVRAIYLCELQVFGERVQKGQSSGFLQVNENGDNVALNKLVSGINLAGDGKDTYQLLVDGNTQTCADSGSLVVGPAFTVDLGGEYLIEAVKLTYAPTCDTSLTGYGCYFHTTMIEISRDGESPEVEVCGHLEDEKGVEAKREANVECESGPMVGRYVTIRKETTSLRSIYLCELKVIGKSQKPEVNSVNLQSVGNEVCKLPKHLVNVALNKKAMQSSTSGNALDGTADKAIDGNKDSDLKEGQSCTLTKKEFGPWWKVDLGRAYDIYQIVITNRQDCCPFRIKSAEVRVGDSPNLEDNPVCGLVPSDSSATEETIAITCRCNTSMTGRYVSVQLADKTQVLHLCEVEVLVEK